MKNKSKAFSVIALLLTAVMLFGACGGNETKTKFPVAETSTAAQTEPAPTEPQPKYSKNDKLIAMTFDDGPYSQTTNKILDTLEANGGVATFFVVGYNIESNIETLQRAIDMGCEIGNHTNDHKSLPKLSEESLKNQIDKPNAMLKEHFGEEPVLLRAPGGATKNIVDKVGMPLIQWSIDTEDWKHKDASNQGRSAEQRSKELNEIARDVFEQADKGDIILMHDIYEFTADLCEIVIPGLVQRGFKLVTVSEMFEAYGEKLESGKTYSSCDIQAVENAVAVDAGQYEVKTSGSVLNMRKDPDINSDVLQKLPNGTKVDVIRSEIGWAYITYNNVSGWVNSAYLKKATV